MLKRNRVSTNYEFDKLQRAHTELSQKDRIDVERLPLAGDVQSEFLGKEMANRPSLDLMRRHEMNRVEGSCPYNMDDQVRRELENEDNEPQHDAGQPSSIPLLTGTDTRNHDENSNDVDLTEVSIIPPPLCLLMQSFLF